MMSASTFPMVMYLARAPSKSRLNVPKHCSTIHRSFETSPLKSFCRGPRG